MKVTLYTQYFNPKFTRRLGRRVNLETAKKFSTEKLEDILRQMKIQYEVREGSYSRIPYEKCKIYSIESSVKKSTLLKMIERKLQ